MHFVWEVESLNVDYHASRAEKTCPLIGRYFGLSSGFWPGLACRRGVTIKVFVSD